MNLWLPRSACGPQCVTGTAPVSRVRGAARLVAVAALAATAGVVLPLLPARRRAATLRRFARGVLRALGMRLVTRGRLPARRALLVANHVSWLDILVLLAVAPCRLVAKVEVRGWPVVGRIAAGTGTVFIDRARPRALPGTVAAVREALAGGALMAAFPEGTTSCGRAVGAFRPALFEAAVATGVPVVPVRLRFRAGREGGTTTLAAYIGDESLLDSLRRILRAERLSVEVVAGTAVHPDVGATRRVLARLAGDALGAGQECGSGAPVPPDPRSVPLPTAVVPPAPRVSVARDGRLVPAVPIRSGETGQRTGSGTPASAAGAPSGPQAAWDEAA